MEILKSFQAFSASFGGDGHGSIGLIGLIGLIGPIKRLWSTDFHEPLNRHNWTKVFGPGLCLLALFCLVFDVIPPFS